MRIEEHPFHILGITPRSSKREILDRAEALSIETDPEKINVCRFQVTHPAKRLDAEVSWFPGVPPRRIRQIIDTISRDSNLPAAFEEKLPGIDCLGRFNALAYWLAAHNDASPAAWSLTLSQLAENLQSLDVDELMATLNADRSAAGQPQITDIASVESAVTRLGEDTGAFLADHLMQCPQHAQVVTLVVEHDTDSGVSQTSDFIGRFVDRYQILVQPTLNRYGDRVGACSERVLSMARASIAQKRPAGGARMSNAIKELEADLSEWGSIARPIQLLMKSRGMKDAHSIQVANRVRTIAVALANDFDLHEQARRITNILYNVFENVPELAELLEQDFEALDGILSGAFPGNDQETEQEETEQQKQFDFDDADAARSPSPTIDPEAITRLATIGAKCILDGADTFQEWCAAMTATVDDVIDWLAKRSGVPRAELLRQVYLLAAPIAREVGAEAEILTPAIEADHPAAPKPDGHSAVGAFVELCRSIRLNCWQRIKENDSHRDDNLTVFKAAYAGYQRQVPPWLAIICDTYRDNTPLVRKARNAAAECLNSIAGGFICVNEFDTARRISLEALPLVFDDEKLDTEIKGQIDFIASEKEKLARSAPRTPPRAKASGAPASRSTVSHAETALPPIINNGKSRFRLPLIVAMGIAVLMAIPFLIQVFSDPEWHPSVADLTLGKTGAGAENQAPRDSQSVPEPVSRALPEASSVPEYKQLVPATPPTYEAVPLLREVTAVPRVAPQEAFREPVSLPNGTDLIPSDGSEGLGKLKISNYTGSDAAVKLKNSLDKATVRFFYVRAASVVTISKIVAGEYVLQFATGRDWDADDLAFRRERGFAVFDKTLSFSEREVDDGTIYSTHEITLHAVPNGNVRKKAISAEEFSDNLGIGSGKGRRR